MIAQNGTLVILFKDFRSAASLKPGVYFGMKAGLNCIRFNQVSGEFVFPIGGDGTDANLEMFVFERRPRLKNSRLGRRRDLIDRCTDCYYKRPISKSSENCIEWKSVELKLTKAQIVFVVDIEFYPNVPVLPLKDGSNAHSTIQEDEPNDIHPDQDIRKPSLRKSDETPKVSVKLRKRDKIKYAISSFRKENRKDLKVDADMVYYDLDSLSNPTSAPEMYQHGNLLSYEDLASAEADEFHDFMKLVRSESAEDEVLPVDVSPYTFFNEAANRLKYSERLNFMNAFSSGNIKLTSYLGGGNWSKSLLSRAVFDWYLQPGINSLSGPPVPPKCPKGMLWEEYYLLNHELYTKDVLR